MALSYLPSGVRVLLFSGPICTGRNTKVAYVELRRGLSISFCCVKCSESTLFCPMAGCGVAMAVGVALTVWQRVVPKQVGGKTVSSLYGVRLAYLMW